MNATPNTPSSSYPNSAVGLDTYLQPIHLSSPQTIHSLPRSATLPGARSALSHYNIPPSDPLTSPDQNPRPAKSPRHNTPSEIGGIGSGRYNTLGSTPIRDQILPHPRMIAGSGGEYLPSSFSMTSVPPISTTIPLPPTWAATNSAPPVNNTTNAYSGQALPNNNDPAAGQQHPSHYHYTGVLNTHDQQHTYAKQEPSANNGQHYTWNR